jgi:hypothetical protein
MRQYTEPCATYPAALPNGESNDVVFGNGSNLDSLLKVKSDGFWQSRPQSICGMD